MKKIFTLIFILITTVFAQQNINPHVILETTQGNIELELYKDHAPLAVENFSTHVKNGYYDGIEFHRIIKNFMIQGGDPTASGRGGESIWKKSFKDEFGGNFVFDRAGILAMANSGPNTNGSQFFITTAPTMWLNGRHTIFGKVVNGISTLKKLNNIKTTGRSYGDRPVTKQKIIRAYIK